MTLWNSVLYVLYNAALPPFVFTVCLILVLASWGKTLGVRKLYVEMLLMIFEYARRVAVKEHKRRDRAMFSLLDTDASDSDSSDLEESFQSASDEAGDAFPDDTQNNGHAAADGDAIASARNALKNFGKESRHNVISRKDNLMLVPDKPRRLSENDDAKKGDGWASRRLAGKEVSADTLEAQFELGDIFDYIKTGIASVIEDEVTQRFVAEELKSWNLLTRTSTSSFEFVNMKLTLFWIAGFFVRYFILLPGRTIILVVGLLFLVFMTTVLGVVPNEEVRKWAYRWAARTCFRILSRSFSAVISFHDTQYRPQSDGICVANHTTPIDVVILQNDQTYALLGWMATCMAFIGQLPEGPMKKWLHHQCFTNCFQILSNSISAVITYHNPENRPQNSGICVANHTSPIDVLILACDNSYALIGQRHGGLIGVFEETLSKCSHHIWFERSDAKDRSIITQRLRDHVEDPNKLPILIFPEGTCINNTSVMQFKKGCFEVGGTIYPVAIKYDAQFGDAFWNSSQNGMVSYIYMMMTSWAIVCDVWYLPPMRRKEDEDAVQFANRVKAEIARQGGLVDLMWDGNLKRSEVKSEWKARQQQDFSRRLKGD